MNLQAITNPITCAATGIGSATLLQVNPSEMLPALTPSGSPVIDVVKTVVAVVGIIPSILHLFDRAKKRKQNKPKTKTP